MDISTALMNIIEAVIVTRSIPTPNFSLSFATSKENSPTDIIAMLEKNGCSSLKLASKNVKNPIAINLDMNIVTIKASINGKFDSITLKFTKVPIEMKNMEVKINA